MARQVRARALRPNSAKSFATISVCDLALANDSQACCRSARLQLWANSKMPSSFPSLDGTARALSPKLAKSFVIISVCDLALANDSQAYCESARQLWADSKMPSSFPSLDAHGPYVPKLSEGFGLLWAACSAQSGPKPSDNFGLPSIACKRLAGLPRVCTPSLRLF